MCGIVGIWGDMDASAVEAMMDRVRHRGPDASGMFRSERESGVLGHRRLSIMDPRGGDQPIYNEDRSMAIVANGEIYNFPQLRPQLTKRHRFRTTSDTEAILHLYEEHGREVVHHLDGMYAFAIADGDRFFAARDPIGIKPLYLGRRNGALVFASELKAFDSECQEVREFPPGTAFDSEQGFVPFYQVPDLPVQERSAEAYAAEVRRTVEEAVVKRLMSDVPLGAFLSGGLDSSIIAAVARQHMDELHTFSVGREGSRDLAAARTVSRHLGTVHHEYVFDEAEIQRHLPQIVYCLESFDQDLVRSGIPCYFTSRLAADHVKVILTGEGADELFGGYTYYKDISDPDVLHRELRRSVASLHNINLQRVDRMTMAWSIEGRVPFLDLTAIELGQRIPPQLKLVGSPPVEKWILRKAFEDLLPAEIVWREKEQFDEGSGTVDMVAAVAADGMSESEAREHRARHPEAGLRSVEECHYHRVFLEVFPDPDTVLANVGRWSARPAGIPDGENEFEPAAREA